MSAHKTNPNIAESRPHCGSCVHYYRDSVSGGHCRALPPTPFYLPQQQSVAGVQLGLVSSYPPTTPDRWCGAHPEFLRWLSVNRTTARDIADLEDGQQAGAA